MLQTVLLSLSVIASISQPRDVVKTDGIHYGFPRVVRAANNDLLLFYRVGATHVADHSAIAMRRSPDNGETWSAEKTLHRDPNSLYSAHNPVAIVAPSGRVILWASSVGFRDFKDGLIDLGDCYWSWSDDHGETWAPFTTFDKDPTRTLYYVTEAVHTSRGMILSVDTFWPGIAYASRPTAGNGFSVLWHSKSGKRWAVLSNLTSPEESEGDEAALMETEPGTLLCLMRYRRKTSEVKPIVHRMWSHDGGRTWSKRENIYSMLDCVLARPFLTRINPMTLLLSGRDQRRKQVVTYVSNDNGKTFGDRRVIEQMSGDGGYTTAVVVGVNKVLMVYYAQGEKERTPALRQVYLTFGDGAKP